jgi:hypothetical protein
MKKKPRDPPPIDYDYMLGLTGSYEESEMYQSPRGRTYFQKENWIYLFPKKGAPMSNEDFTPIPIQNWDTTPKCPKCEAERDEITMKWKTGVANKDGSLDTVNGEKYDVPEGFEHLHSKCEGCGFEWLMQTADADERATAAKEAAEEKEEEKEEDEDAPVTARGHGSRIVRGGA